MQKYLLILFLFFAFLTSNTGHAFYFYQPIPGLYVGIFGGISGGYRIKNHEAKTKDYEGRRDCCQVRTNSRYYVGAKLGKMIYPFLRLEGEFVWQENDIHESRVRMEQMNQMDRDRARGHAHIWSLMANALVDFNFCFPQFPPVVPFIGVGIGHAQAHASWKETFEKYHCIKSSMNKKGIAWQVTAGLKYLICPELEANLEYRFFSLEGRVKNHKLGLALTKFF